MRDQYLWTEKYRPKTISATILPPDIKKIFNKYVAEKNIPNLILSGPPGLGKTTVAKAMLEELGCDYIVINGSMFGNIDTLRNDILEFASTVSFSGGRKYVILDEADYLNANSTQPALRNFMEEYASNCGFILTCNYLARIIPELQSRASIISFQIKKKDAPELAKEFFKRIKEILKLENIPYDSKVVAHVIQEFYPDWRKILTQLQSYSSSEGIDSGILSSLNEKPIKELVDLLKEKNFTKIRKWTAENLDGDHTSIFRKLYDASSKYLTPQSVAQLVLIIGKYQYQAAFVADQEINLMACFTEIMVDCEFS